MAEGDPTQAIVGSAPAIDALRGQIRHLAAFDTPRNPHVPTVLLQGETGTGKGLVSRVIHASGGRARAPFIDVNCAAIPETMLEAELFGFEAGAFTDARRAKPGLFEAAAGGTLFLDEIDTLPVVLQGKLLKAIEEKSVRRLGSVTAHRVDVKLVAATAKDLRELVAAGGFRADLYHRLAVASSTFPRSASAPTMWSSWPSTSLPRTRRRTGSTRRASVAAPAPGSRRSAGRATCASSPT